MSSSAADLDLDLNGLSITNDNYDSHLHPQHNPSAAFFSTAPPSSAPYGAGAGGVGGGLAPSPNPNGFGEAGHFNNNTIAGLSSKPRGGLPSHWLDQPSSSTSGSGSLVDGRSLSPPTTDLSSAGSPPPPQGMLGAQGMLSQSMMGQSPLGTGLNDDDIIPTAIVIKNIPFSVRRETLLEIIASLSIPTPYAFNYHVDGAGAFRGLAFANFRQAQDADAVVAALNGFEVQGRKLRVEYKKVLQAGEKERIEREKAIRRMKSMQMERERQQAVGGGGGNGGDWEDYGQVQNQSQYTPGGLGIGHPSPGLASSPARTYSNGHLNQLAQQQQPNLPSVPPVPQIPAQYFQRQNSQHQQQPPMLNVTTPPPMPEMNSIDQYHPHLQRSFSPPSTTSISPPPMMMQQRGYQQQSQQQQQQQPEPQQQMPEATPTAQPKNYAELDMNDPSTLEIYSRILLFKDDRMRDELAFSRSLTPLERRVVHMVAKKLGLYHRSVGEGAERYAVVMRYPPDNSRPPPPARQPSHTLSRAQSSYLSASTGPPATPSPNRTLPTSSGALRVKKSMPDLGSLNPPSSRLNARASNGNIREGYATISGSGRRGHNGFSGLFNTAGNGSSSVGVNEDGTIPPVPSLPSNLDASIGGAGGSVMRQPRGPGGGGFGQRRASEMNSISNGSRFGASTNTAPKPDGSGLDTRSHEPFEP